MATPRTTERSGSLTGDETIDEVLAAHPDLRLPLMGFGLCACCTGTLTLRQNAEVRGLPLDTLLTDLNRELLGRA